MKSSLKYFAILTVLLSVVFSAYAQDTTRVAPDSAAAKVDTVSGRDTLPREIKEQTEIPDTLVKPKSDTVAQRKTSEKKLKPDKKKSKVAKRDTTEEEAKKTVEKAAEELKPPAIEEIISVGKIFWAVVFLGIGWFAIRIVSSLLELFAERSAKYRLAIKGFIPIVRILGWIIVLYIIVAGIFRPPWATLLAVSASAGIAVGFAAQDVIKNIFGGVMILMDRPFQTGDKIEVGEHYGEVTKIGLRSTRIVTPDDSVVTIPNSELMNKSVSNSNSGAADCQVVAELFLPIDVDTSKARAIALEAAQISRFVYLKKPIVVLFFNEVKNNRAFLKMRLKAYVTDIRYEFAFKSDMTEIAVRELIRRGVVNPDDLR